ncbi:aminodeoxychorismate synthase component I [Kitasatospora kifunensis]|uniref:aminodeoxychorismate synthase n=1 Tax=Kitasatospora kifunensis TaxID=58351 RepID=A0A7W7R8L4_KITKI|nr:aminodeoxychorismate synthase component I [Kitasatospora kifunensis]MBB4927430.1 para-aminobenzoate synthetase [Kitasatospora kifunensis]
MRTLLVDNYDSFTYNLFHYLAEVNGVEPEVIRNDDPSWRPQLLDGFDNVVLSPGPGTPHRPADFGLCAQIAEQGQLPVLGVCLGHQGLALAHGGRVVRAPEPRHGRASLVRHDGTGLFEGLPNPLEVVRYHSLAVTGLAPELSPGLATELSPELAPELEATAWAEDGVLMALRHRTLPLWGVQFHPESIGTEGGHQLLANFRNLTIRHERYRRPSAPAGAHRGGVEHAAVEHAAVEHARAEHAPVTRRLRVLAEHLLTRWDPEVVFDRVLRGDEHAFWLDSSRSGEPLGRLSIMGNAAGPLARVATADVVRGTVTVRSAESTRVVHGEFLPWLEQDLRQVEVEVPELPFDFALGWVGALGYELKAECDGDQAHRSPDPDAVMVFADRAIVFDHLTGTTHLLALAELPERAELPESGQGDVQAPGGEQAARDWLARTAAELAGLVDLAPDPCQAPEAPLGEEAGLRLRHDREAYLKLIDICQQEIQAGETYEVCLTNMIEAEIDLDPWQAYRFLRRTSPAPFAAFLDFAGLSVLSSSPERFLRIDRHGLMESKPIKGTRPRGADPQEDALLVAELATCEKDRAENLMIVDLVRHDLGRCAEIGSVVAGPVFQVETYATVHQLVSTVRAQLSPGTSAVAGVRSAFPGGSMTGAPKIRTMQIIDRLEAGPRGLYSGAIGYFSLTGAADLSITIRTVVLSHGRLRYGVGGAIIALSDPVAEFEETVVKATPLLRLLGTQMPGRRVATAGSGASGSGHV